MTMNSARGIVCALALAAAAICAAAEGAVCAAQSLSVRDFGAAGDGVADDSGAFQRAFAQAGKAGRSQVRIPAGTYRLERPVSVALDDDRGKGLSIIGEGQGVSVLLVASTNGALRVSDASCKAQVAIRALTLLAACEGAGTAIEVTSPLRGARNYRTLTVESVDIRGEGLPTRKYFTCGVRAVAQWRPLFDNVVFCGASDPALNGDRRDASPLYAPEAGFVADWCYAPTFRDCYAWSAHTGYRVVSERLRDEGPEDGAFYRCTANGVRVGIDVRTPIIEPQLVIDACHVNARDAGIRLAKRKFFHITNCLMYGFDQDQDLPYTDIELSDCYAGVITGNIFHSPAPDNLRKEPAVARIMIRADASCRDLVVSENVFNAKGLSVDLARGAKGVEMRGNRCSNAQARPPAEAPCGASGTAAPAQEGARKGPP
jgi:hypothetical protein